MQHATPECIDLYRAHSPIPSGDGIAKLEDVFRRHEVNNTVHVGRRGIGRSPIPFQERQQKGVRSCDLTEWLERPPAGAFELLRQYPPELLLNEPSPKPLAPRKATREEPDEEPAEA